MADIARSQNGNVPSGQTRTTIINESGLYSLILSSKLPKAKEFKRWITSEVLPSIRKTGGFVADEQLFVNTYLANASAETKALFALQLSAIREMNEKIKADKPKVEFADHVADTTDLIDMSALSKIMQNYDITIGRNQLFDWLRKSGYLRQNNEPYQRYIEQGLFRVREYAFETSRGSRTGRKTYVTGKGQMYIAKKLREESAKNNLTFV